MRKYIGIKMIEDGLMSKVIKPILDDDGLKCYIGEYWFYFGGTEFEFSDPKDILPSTVAAEIKLALDSFYDDEIYETEYLYYYYYLIEHI